MFLAVWGGRLAAGVHVNENSSQYKLGAKIGTMFSLASAALGGLTGASSLADDAVRLSDDTYEIIDGVRRAKAADLVGNGTIPAEIMDATGNSVATHLPIDKLLSPKSVIDVGPGPAMDRWKKTYDLTKSGSAPPPILVVPGKRGTSIKDVGFGVGGP